MVAPKLVARIESEEPALRLAVLIDADNAQAAVIDSLLAEIARFGEATVKRIYGDFTSPTSASWKKVLQRHAIKPVQQFAYTTGKNATDSALIIDAMDLLYTQRFDGFCLVTSDSDFTGLAMRLREAGLKVLGFGEQKTPEAFRNACHRFLLTELLRPPAEMPGEPARSVEPAGAAPVATGPAAPPPTGRAFPKQFMLEALAQSSDETGWAHLGTFGHYLTKLQPDFDARLFGHRKLSDLVRARTDLFVVEERQTPGATKKELYVHATT
jgi:uncharacterized LabA/DUF88 family protein